MKLRLHEPVLIDVPGLLGVYWLRIYEAEKTAVVVTTWVPASGGPSPTNAASEIARHVVRTYLSSAVTMRWFECYPAGHFDSRTRYAEVRFKGGSMEPVWPRDRRNLQRADIESIIGGPLHLLPPHDEVLERVLTAGGRLDPGTPTTVYTIVPVDDLPPPKDPFRCSHHERFIRFMKSRNVDIDTTDAPRALRDEFYRQLRPDDYDACYYHKANWIKIVAESVRIVEQLGEYADKDQVDQAVASAEVPTADRGWLASLFNDAIMWADGTFINGQHRACAIRASGARRVVRIVDGPPTPESTWTITDEA